MRRAPLVDCDGALLGVISTDDLLRFIAAQHTGLAQLGTRQTRPATPRAGHHGDAVRFG